MKKRAVGSWISLFVKLSLIAFVGTALVFALLTFANFGDNVERLSFHIKTNDSQMAKKDLIGLHYFYDLSRKWKVQWMADKYLFKDAPFYEAADSYLIRDWEKVKAGLKEKQDDPGAYPYGNAKFRQAQIFYRAGDEKTVLDFVLTEVASDYEKALKNCLGSGVTYDKCFDRVWNYDLVTNKKNAEEALKNPEPVVKYILGPPKKEGEPILPPPLVPGGSKEGEQKQGPGGQPKRP